MTLTPTSPRKEFSIIPKMEGNQVDRNETITLLQLQRGAKIVGIRFTQTGRDGSRYPSKCYYYKSVFPVDAGNLVVVESAEGFKCGSVDKVGIDYTALEEEGVSLGELKHVIGIVNLAAHASIKIEERRLLEVVMQAELAERMAQMTSNPMFQALMATPTPVLSAYGTRHNPETGEVV